VVIPRKTLALLSSGCLLAAVLAACSSNSAPPNATGVVGFIPERCRVANAGCECSSEGAAVQCGEKVESEKGGLVCKTGTRTCRGGVWGACDTGPATASKGLTFASNGPLGLSPQGVSPKGLGGAGACSDPCNPSCTSYQDSATGLDAGAGFSVQEGGVTLAATATCNTIIKGQIYDPGDNLPLPNVYAFLQEGALAALPEGVAQDSCSTILTGGSGGGVPDNRVQSALDGSFTLQIPNGYPSGTNFNIVIQTGRWRKVVPLTANCATQNLGHVRLPKNKAEGNIPQMAIVMAEADTLECFIAKVGVDVSEFTRPSDSGRVHVYQGCLENCGPVLSSAAPHNGPAPDKRTSLLATQAEIDKHAMLVLPCEGGRRNGNVSQYPNDAEVQRVKTFADNGGRIFATHLSDLYLYHEGDGGGTIQDLYGGTATYKTGADNMFNNSGTGVGSVEATVNTVPPRAQTFYDWLVAVGGLNGNGRVQFVEGRRRSLAALPPLGQTWLPNYNSTPFTFYNYVHHVTFDTPVGSPNPEGRVVYLSSHVAPVAYRRQNTGTFPGECNLTNALTPSEKALEYMLFDVSACVGAPPPAPAPLYTAATFTRDFIATCPVGTRVRWRQFEADVETPSDSRIQFRAQTADSVAAVGASTSYNVHLAQGLTPDTPVGGVMLDSDQGGAMTPPTKSSRNVLRISADFVPATGGLLSPAMYTWTQKYDCEASE